MHLEDFLGLKNPVLNFLKVLSRRELPSFKQFSCKTTIRIAEAKFKVSTHFVTESHGSYLTDRKKC